MSELIDKMNQQFTDMQKLATDYAAMAEQAIDERDKARDALRECRTALEAFMAIQLPDSVYREDSDTLAAKRVARVAIQSAINALEGK